MSLGRQPSPKSGTDSGDSQLGSHKVIVSYYSHLQTHCLDSTQRYGGWDSDNISVLPVAPVRVQIETLEGNPFPIPTLLCLLLRGLGPRSGDPPSKLLKSNNSSFFYLLSQL